MRFLLFYNHMHENKRNEKLKIIADKHRDWVKVCKAYGGGDYAEDLVQEMYIRLIEKPEYLIKCVPENKCQDGYVFFIIRTMLINYQRKQAKRPIDTVLETFHFIEDDREDLSNKLALEQFYKLIDEHISEWRWYDRKIFEIYKDTDLSIRGIASKTDISYVSIFHTLKQAKNRINEALWQHWLNYKKGNYERLF